MRAVPSRTSSSRRGPDAEEGVAAEPLAALDGLEEVGRRRAVVEAEERADRRLEVGRARGAQQQRVGVRGEALRLRQAERIRCGHVRRLRRPVRPRIKTTFRPRDERSSLPRCHPHSAMPHSRDRRAVYSPPIGAALYRWRSAPEPTGVRVAASPFGPEAPGSIRRRRRPGFHQPPGLSADARRVLVPFTARIRDVGRESRQRVRAKRQGADCQRRSPRCDPPDPGSSPSGCPRDSAQGELGSHPLERAAITRRTPLPSHCRRRLIAIAEATALGAAGPCENAPSTAFDPRDALSDVAVLGVAPGEALAGGHLEDHRVTLAEGVRAAVARLRLAAADVAARRAEAQPVVASRTPRSDRRSASRWLRARERSRRWRRRIVRAARSMRDQRTRV